MADKDPIPASDQDFDTLQGILVTKVTANKLAWGIPDAEITKLTDKQTVWDAAWLIAKDKLNSTSAQKKSEGTGAHGLRKSAAALYTKMDLPQRADGRQRCGRMRPAPPR